MVSPRGQQIWASRRTTSATALPGEGDVQGLRPGPVCLAFAPSAAILDALDVPASDSHEVTDLNAHLRGEQWG